MKILKFILCLSFIFSSLTATAQKEAATKEIRKELGEFTLGVLANFPHLPQDMSLRFRDFQGKEPVRANAVTKLSIVRMPSGYEQDTNVVGVLMADVGYDECLEKDTMEYFSFYVNTKTKKVLFPQEYSGDFLGQIILSAGDHTFWFCDEVGLGCPGKNGDIVVYDDKNQKHVAYARAHISRIFSIIKEKMTNAQIPRYIFDKDDLGY